MIEPIEIRKQFLHSIKLGTGEAYLLQSQYKEIDFSKEIIKGAIQNFAYDRQLDGSRAFYMYGLIKKSLNKDRTVYKLLKILEKSSYAEEQLWDLAVMMYKDGYLMALESMYKCFENGKLEDYEITGDEHLVEIGGEEAIVKVAEKIGYRLLNGKEEYNDSFLIDAFQKKNRSFDVYEILRSKGEGNLSIKAYYDSINDNKYKPFRRLNWKSIKYTYELLDERIKANKFRIISTEKANNLNDDEVMRLANDFMNTKDVNLRDCYLRFFAKRQFPLDYKILLTLASSKNDRYTLDALSLFKNEEIREFAIRKIKNVKKPSDFLCLLVKNYKTGDDELLLEVISRFIDFEYIHSLSSGVLDIYRTNITKECKLPLESIYQRMNCGLCRAEIVKILHINDVLSDQILREIKFDSDDDTRKYFRKIKKLT